MTHTHKWRVVAELAASQHGAFHRTQAADHLSTRTLRRAEIRGDLLRPLTDVYVVASFRQSWKQSLSVLGQAGGLVSHRSAAALHGLDGISPGKFEVTVERNNNRSWLPNTTVHTSTRIDEADRHKLDGIACTSIERTLIDLAAVLPVRQVEPALDTALRNGLAIEALRIAIERLRRPGPVGIGALERLLDDPSRGGPLPDSLFERLVERVVLDAALPAPERQFEIALPTRDYRVDLAWPTQQVAVEAHSKRWHFGRQAGGNDNARDLALAAAGWEVLYVTWAMAQEPDLFLHQLQSVLARRQLRSAI